MPSKVSLAAAHYLWRAVDHEGDVLESFATKTRDKPAVLKFLKKLTVWTDSALRRVVGTTS